MKNLTADIIVKIPFFDVDSMGVAWHGHAVKYIELARCALLDKIGYNYTEMRASGYAWPIVSLKVKYIRSFYFDQEIKIKAELVEYENCIKMKYVITDPKTGEKLTNAETMQMAVNMKTGETCYESPKVFLDKMK